MKHNINHRLLKYKLSNFDYSKINNKAYFKRYEIRLKANYIYNTLGLEHFIKYLTKQKNIKFFRILQNDFKEIYNTIQEKFNLIPNSERDRQRVYELKYDICKCKECNKQVEYKRLFCSNKCSNNFKAKDENFIKTLSESVEKWHSTVSDEEKEIKNSKISKSVNKTVYSKSKEERRKIYGTKTGVREAYSRLNEKFPNIEILFDEDFYYENKYLPVKCKECGFKWEMTKTSTYERKVCTKCVPYKKHKTQTSIFDYIVEKGFDVKENDKSFISNEIDINVKDKKLCIEYNGLLSHSFGNSKIWYFSKYDINSNYHLDKTQECEGNGAQLLHIFENEFINKTKKEIWMSIINNKLNLNSKIYARKTIIKEIPYKEASVFLEENHLQGKCNSKINIGLYYNEELVSLMTFSKPRFNSKYEWELIRLCSKKNINVIGGASKLLKYFENTYKPKSLISYANRRWSKGEVYEKLGFDFSHNSAPNYFYFKENENILYSRNQFQKHKLKDLLEIFNENKTETQNMFDNNYRVIYDSGNKVYVKKYSDM